MIGAIILHKWHRGLLCLLTFVMLVATGCMNKRSINNANPSVIGDIAFDNTNSEVCEIYIPEAEELTPYLVLTSEYGGEVDCCLLLRKELLEDLFIFGEMPDAPYYGASFVDNYLNSEFLNTLSNDVASLIITTDIVVTASTSIWIDGDELENIYRKIFLLSATECGYTAHSSPLIEGSPLAYFNSDTRRIASIRGENTAWWLRTPNRKNAFAWCVYFSGTITFLSIETELGIRPAFCLPSSLPIEAFDINGKTGYRLSNTLCG